MPTKLTLDWDVLSGPFGNGLKSIRTKIDGKPEKLPFEQIYLKESPFEVLKFLARDYNVNTYLDIQTNIISSFDFKKHSIGYGFSIQESKLSGVKINNKIKKDLDFSFIPAKKDSEKDYQELIKNLIREYIVVKHTMKGPIYGGIKFGEIGGRGPQSDTWEETKNYFKDRKNPKKINPEKEKQLFQIIEYAQVILNNPKFSLSNLEKLVGTKKIKRRVKV